LFDKINLEFFQTFFTQILKNELQSGSIRKIDLFKKDRSVGSLRIAGLRNMIMQRGITLILKYLSKHRFDKWGFNFRKEISHYNAISFIKKTISFEM